MMSCSNTKVNRLEPIELLARIVGWQDTPIVTANVNAVTWSAYILEEATGDENAVTTYQDVTLTPVGSYVESSLLLNNKWTEDAIGYNFHFIAPGELFDQRGEIYLIRVLFDMVGGDEVTAIFLLEVV